MAIAYDDVTVLIPDLTDQLEGSLDLSLEEEDNEDTSEYFVGTQYFVRLYKKPQSLVPSVTNSLGSIFLNESDLSEEITEVIVFSRTDTVALSKAAFSNFSYVKKGKVFDLDGNEISSPFFYISEENPSNIKSPISCSGVLAVTYTTYYDLYQFTATETGTALLEATATYEEEILYSNLTIDIVDGSAEEGCMEPLIEFQASTHEAYLAFNPEGDFDAKIRGVLELRIANVERSRISAAVTLGSIKFIEVREAIYENEVVSGTDCSFSAEHAVTVLSSQTILGGNVGNLRVENGQLKMDGIPNSSVKDGIPYGTGVFKISYVSRYLYFQISSIIPGKGYLVLQDLNDPTCPLQKFPYEITDWTLEYIITDDEENLVDITVVYKDYITGTSLGGVSVSVDGTHRGITNSDGTLLVRNLARGVTHNITASKPGYLDTESDSLANDSFLLPEEEA